MPTRDDERQVAFKIAAYIHTVTRPIPPTSVDTNSATDFYASHLSKEPLGFAGELARITGEQLTLVGRTQKRKSDARPKSTLLWLWNNALCPTYTLSLYWKDGEVHRAFLNDPQEIVLLRTRPVRVILLRSSDCISALDIDLSAADEDLWRRIDAPRPPSEHLGDRIGGKAYALAGLDELITDPLTRSWVDRLSWEAGNVVAFCRNPVNAARLQAETSVVAESPAGPYIQNADSVVVGLYKYFEDSAASSQGPVLKSLQLRSELEGAPCHAPIASEVFEIWWFSGRRTSHGHCIPSIEHWLTEDPVGTNYTISSIQLDSDSLGERAGEFWKRTTLTIPFYYGRLIGGRNLPLDLAEFAASAPIYTGNEEEGETFATDLLAEARTLKQWTIPFGAYVQLEAGPLRALRLFEMGSDIIGLFVNQKGEYLYASVDPSGGQIAIPIPPKRDYFRARLEAEGRPVTPEEAERLCARLSLGLQILLAAAIRDFWVVEERQALFGTGRYTRKGARLRADNGKEVLVYLPRIRYVADCGRRPEALELRARKTHFVVGHLRKALHATADQLFHARRYGVKVPEGFTFVRPHQRGHLAERQAAEERKRVYRSRSALRCIEAISSPPALGDHDAWFMYELRVKEWLAQNGFTVDHLAADRRGDGGVDIQAAKGGEFLLIQCKYWNRERIGPRIVREMLGTLKTFPAGSRGVIITSSELTAGAKELAEEHGVQFIESVNFANRIAQKVT